MSASAARIGAAAKRVSTLRVSLYPFLQSFSDSCTQDGRKLRKGRGGRTGVGLPGILLNRHEPSHGAFFMLSTCLASLLANRCSTSAPPDSPGRCDEVQHVRPPRFT